MSITKVNNWNAAFISLIVFITISCKKPTEEMLCTFIDKAPVTKVDGIKTGLVNTNINLTVSFICYNGCGQFGYFNTTNVGDTSIITTMAAYNGCICTQDIPTRQATYTFKAAKPGKYYLHFLQMGNNYLLDSLIIN